MIPGFEEKVEKALRDIEINIVHLTNKVDLQNRRIDSHKEEMLKVLHGQSKYIANHEEALYHGNNGIGLIAKVEDHNMYISKKRLSSGSLLDWSFRGFVGFVLTVIMIKLNIIPIP
jgi:hypothetical protein